MQLARELLQSSASAFPCYNASSLFAPPYGSTLEKAYEHTARVWLQPFDDLRAVAKRAASPTTLTSVAKAVKDMYYRWKTMRSVSPLVYKRASVSDFLVGDATIHAELVAWVLKQLLKKRSGVDPFVVPVNAPLGSGARARAGVGAGDWKPVEQREKM